MSAETDAKVDQATQAVKDATAALMATITLDRAADTVELAAANKALTDGRAALAEAQADDRADDLRHAADQAHINALVNTLKGLGYNEDGTPIGTTPPPDPPADNRSISLTAVDPTKIATLPINFTSSKRRIYVAGSATTVEWGNGATEGRLEDTVDGTGREFTNRLPGASYKVELRDDIKGDWVMGTITMPTSPVPPPTLPPAAGFYSTKGKDIIKPGGGVWVGDGAGMLGPHTWWARPTLGRAKAFKAWGFEICRLSCGYSGGMTTNDDLFAIISEYTGEGIIVLLEMHSFGNGGYPDQGQLQTLINWWLDIAARFKTNPLVWANMMNEPGSSAPVSDLWRSTADAWISAMLGAGWKSPLVLDGNGWGQDAMTWDGGPVPTQNSALLTHMPALIAKYPGVPLIGALHVYDQWTQGEAKMRDYFLRVRAAGVPLIVGEVGDKGYVGEYRDFTPAFDAAIKLCRELGITQIFWHGQGDDTADGSGDGFALTTSGDLGNYGAGRTRAGEAEWSLAHAR